jgi:hypothetical protein
MGMTLGVIVIHSTRECNGAGAELMRRVLRKARVCRSRDAFVRLSRANLIVLFTEAPASTVPVVDNALGVTRTAFRKVDGVIVNRRRFEVPPHILRWLQR